jgi:outer membrane protein TolC
VIHRVVEAYTGAVLAAAQGEVAREALDTSRAHVRLVRDFWESGLVVRSDLLEAEVRASEVQEMRIVAASAVEVTRAALNVAMGLAPEGPFVPLRGIDSVPEQEDSLELLAVEAREARPDLRAADARIEAAERAERLARSGRRPEVGFVGSYEANDPDFVGTEGTNWSLAVAARFSVFDGFETRSRVQRAREERVRAERMRDLLEQNVGLEVRQAYYGLQAARQRLEQARRAVERAGEGLRIVEDRYREGLATWLEVREAETSRTRSRSREISAARDVLLGSYTLELAVGRL